MLDYGIKVEQDALAANSLEFVADTYLPDKLESSRKNIKVNV